MEYRRVKVAEDGRIAIPAEYQAKLGIEVGEDILLELADGEICPSTGYEAIRHAWETVRRYVPEGVSISDELIAERRAEAVRE